LSKDNPTMTIKAALTAAGAGKIPPGPSDPDERINRYPGILKSGEAPATRQQAGAQAEAQLNAALGATKALFATAKVTELTGASDPVGLGYNPNSPAIPPGTQGIAQLFTLARERSRGSVAGNLVKLAQQGDRRCKRCTKGQPCGNACISAKSNAKARLGAHADASRRLIDLLLGSCERLR
jgi:hypothetical protein